MKNVFWREVFLSVKAVMQGALFSEPEKILLAPFWRNPVITRNRKQIKETDFPMLDQKVKTLSDFIKPCTRDLYTKDEFQQRHGISVNEDTFIELRYIVTCTIKEYSFEPDSLPLFSLPIQPLLVSIATRYKKGCSNFYRCLRNSIVNCFNQISKREHKWHLELNTLYQSSF